MVKSAHGVISAIALAVLVCGCTSATSQPPAGSQSVPAASSPAASASAASPAPLRVSQDVDLGVASAQGRPVAAEGPDGAVFYADGNVVMVVDGSSAPQAAEHPGAPVLGLGASATTLYVVTPRALIAYRRSDGNQAGRWALTGSPATPTTAGVAVGGNGEVWVWTDWATDFSGYEDAMVYGVLPGMAKPDVVSAAAEPGTLTTDGTHAYFLVASKNSLGASLMRAAASPGGAAPVTLTTAAAAPTQALVGYSQSQVVLYAQPDSLYTYTPGASGTSVVTTAGSLPVGVAGTSSGLLFLTCGKQACATVTQVNQSSGKPGASVTLPANSEILLGPDPVVLGTESGHLHLVRLG